MVWVPGSSDGSAAANGRHGRCIFCFASLGHGPRKISPDRITRLLRHIANLRVLLRRTQVHPATWRRFLQCEVTPRASRAVRSGVGALGHGGVGALGHWSIGALQHCSIGWATSNAPPASVRKNFHCQPPASTTCEPEHAPSHVRPSSRHRTRALRHGPAYYLG